MPNTLSRAVRIRIVYPTMYVAIEGAMPALANIFQYDQVVLLDA